ncbi:hypothetical protein EKI60_06290 [Candidatus Saccharibacteria bacterium]|nr:MAG: hypothetical protein EKI60_06290 [Candidatus Saccharibacteria bacterium]
MSKKTVTLRTNSSLGIVTRTKLKNAIQDAGSVKALATRLNVTPGTVRSWRWRLNERAAGRY